ncbi:nucleoside deaminase [Nocardioides agariphilus]|jgi:tRNA(Arg) A34 adenosine deaminase TadA|uniref:Nucleoside deaminase n=1 Tax=Nocardioides agariphilus TaxID=433664 RepID=A0A930VPK0_9ACTN|nr:nucleoside deaminase [Nocardioides agariphilus]
MDLDQRQHEAVGHAEQVPTDDDLDRLRRAIAVSQYARDHGNHPFGAVLVSPGGDIVLEAENTVVTEHDVTNHAETNLVRLASRTIDDDLRHHTLVTSCEPCPMCAGAIFWAGIGRVVYGLSQERLHEVAGSDPDTSLMHACRLVFAAGGRRTDVVGPLLEDEAAVAHHDFWS